MLHARWFFLLGLLVLSSRSLPAPLLVGGTVLDARGETRAGATVELIRVPSPTEEWRLHAEGAALPAPLASARTDAAGRFSLTAPEEGLFYVIVRSAGHVPLSYLLAAVEETELPPARLVADASLTVRVVGPGRKPVAGARVRIGASRIRRHLREDPWSVALRLGTTGNDGSVTLAHKSDEKARIQVLAKGYAPGSALQESLRNTAEVLLAAGCPRDLEIQDAGGKPMAGVSVETAGWSQGTTDSSGRLHLFADCREETRLSALAADGRAAQASLRPGGKDGSLPVKLILPPRAAGRPGRVVETGSRQPIPGAFVWLPEAPSVFARTGVGGLYALPDVPAASTAARQGVVAAAAGYSEGQAELAPAGAAPTLALSPGAVIEGSVSDAAGKPVAGAEIESAAPILFKGSVARTRSGPTGRFRLRIAPGYPQTLWVQATGFAPAVMQTSPLSPRASHPGLKVVLSRGRTGSGQLIDGAGAPVAGAQVELSASEPAAAGELPSRPWGADPLRAASDPGGRFFLPHLAGGRYDLKAEAPGFAATVVRGLTVPAAEEPVDLGTVVLQRGVTLGGLVVDRGERPLAGATVKLWFPPRGQWPAFRLANDPGERETRTDGEGRFTLSDLTPGTAVRLLAQAPGFVASEVLQVNLPAPEPVRLDLTPSVRVSGRVVDEAGAAVPAAGVKAVATGGVLNDSRADAPRAYSTTDERGRFTLEGLKPGRLEVSAEARGYISSPPRAVELLAGRDVGDLELRVETGATIEGQVQGPDATPVDDARVEIASQERPTSLRAPFPPAAVTDGDGNFRLIGIPPGKQTLSAEHDDYLRAVKDVEVRAGEVTRVEIRLGSGLSVAGRVVDAAGLPVPGAEISAHGSGGSRLWRQSAADGTFRINGLSPGPLSLEASKEGKGKAHLADLQLAETSLSGVELKLVPGGAIVGRLLGLSPADLPRAEVRASSSHAYLAPQNVDFEGRYRIDDLAPGDWTVAATLASTGRATSGKAHIPGPGAEVTLDLDFSGGLTLAGRVISGGQPLGDVYVYAGAAEPDPAAGPFGDQGGASAVSDGSGHFRLEGLKAGTYRLTASHRRLGLTHEEKEAIELSRSREDVLIDIPANVRVRGRVSAAGTREPIAGVAISFARETEDGEPPSHLGRDAGQTDEQGTWSISAPPGKYRVMARKAGYSPGEARVDLSSNPSTEVSITLSPAPGLSIQVLPPGGVHPAYVFAALVEPGGRSVVGNTFSPDEEGRVQISQAPPGRFTLVVKAQGTAAVSLPVSVPSAPLQVALPSGTPLVVSVPALAEDPRGGRLRVLAADGQPFRTVSWGGSLNDEWPLQRGRAELDDLPPGRYTVEVKTVEGKTYQATILARGEPVTQILE